MSLGRTIVVERRLPSVEELEVEIVERKGLGHPDYMCDAIAEAVSRGLSSYYLKAFGRILHHNVDKVLLVGGQANPVFGGGSVVSPIYIIVSGRVTTEVRTEGGVEAVPYGSIILSSVKDWIRKNFRFLDPEEHVVVDFRIGKGSVDLVGVFEAGRETPLANDTSLGIGYAPLSTLERLVLESERLLNSRETKSRIPAIGEDVKVMGVRHGRRIELTIASAIVSRFVNDKDEYYSVKEEIRDLILDLASKISPGHDVEVYVNTADNPEKGIFYLTVTGTSSEHGDDGSTGRGNRVNGLITPMRPMSMEATAGKNPVNHVGKIYNVMARDIAERIYREVRGVREAYVKIVSQIGKPIDKPLITSIELKPESGGLTSNMIEEAKVIARETLESASRYTEAIVRGEVTLF